MDFATEEAWCCFAHSRVETTVEHVRPRVSWQTRQTRPSPLSFLGQRQGEWLPRSRYCGVEYSTGGSFWYIPDATVPDAMASWSERCEITGHATVSIR